MRPPIERARERESARAREKYRALERGREEEREREREREREKERERERGLGTIGWWVDRTINAHRLRRERVRIRVESYG